MLEWVGFCEFLGLKSSNLATLQLTSASFSPEGRVLFDMCLIPIFLST